MPLRSHAWRLVPCSLVLGACYVGLSGDAGLGVSPHAPATSGPGEAAGTTSTGPAADTDLSSSGTTLAPLPTSGAGTLGVTAGDGSSGTTGEVSTSTTGDDTTAAPPGDTTIADETTGPGVCTDGSPGSVTGAPGDGGTIASVCARWHNDTADSGYGPWCGDLAACDAGDVAAAGRTNTLRVLNLYRWLADLPPVTSDPARDAGAQACALLLHANGQLSHTPTPAWACYSQAGASAAAQSNIAASTGFSAVGLYMRDPGNATTFVHRRWILSNSLGPVGLGSTSAYSCMWVLGGGGKAGKPWTAWPPPGIVPLAAASQASLTAWTIQSDSIPLAGAQVSVTEDGQPRPVVVQGLLANYGSAHAISIDLDGWQVQAGSTYAVSLTGIGQPIAYAFQVVDCP